jgi:hypothetical protein
MVLEMIAKRNARRRNIALLYSGQNITAETVTKRLSKLWGGPKIVELGIFLPQKND